MLAEPEITGRIPVVQRDAKARIMPGASLNPAGRPKGSRNKLNEKFIEALYEDFQAHGEEAIAEVRQTDPGSYLRIVASLVPKQLNIRDETPTTELSDDELTRVLDAVRAIQDFGSGQIAGSREIKTINGEPAQELQPVPEAASVPRSR